MQKYAVSLLDRLILNFFSIFARRVFNKKFSKGSFELRGVPLSSGGVFLVCSISTCVLLGMTGESVCSSCGCPHDTDDQSHHKNVVV